MFVLAEESHRSYSDGGDTSSSDDEKPSNHDNFKTNDTNNKIGIGYRWVY